MDRLEVSIQQTDDGVALVGGGDRITVKTTHPGKIVYPHRADFAVWFFLPIAMRTNRLLHIHGSGTRATIRNAATMSNAWQSWLPGHFYSTGVSFDRELDCEEFDIAPGRDLCFYSGGIDSTHTILKRTNEGKSQDLLTVHGQDYKTRDEEKFERFYQKTKPFAELASNTRIIVETDAYPSYVRHRINPKKGGYQQEVCHIFNLAGAGFLYAMDYRQIIIAADVRLDQQFTVYPWGNNSATNFLFDDGMTQLITDSDDITRCQKIPLLLESATALESLTFCSDYSVRPDLCGICATCMRTKLMFLANSGKIPPIFLTDEIPHDWFRSFIGEKQDNRAAVPFFIDIVSTAKAKGQTAAFPAFEENENGFLAYHSEKRQQADSRKNRSTFRLSPARLLRIIRKRIARISGK